MIKDGNYSKYFNYLAKKIYKILEKIKYHISMTFIT